MSGRWGGKDYTIELKFSLLGSKESIPTFRQVLDFVDGRVALLIELKMTEEREDLSCGAPRTGNIRRVSRRVV